MVWAVAGNTVYHRKAFGISDDVIEGRWQQLGNSNQPLCVMLPKLTISVTLEGSERSKRITVD
jgi:hypothetical protein